VKYRRGFTLYRVVKPEKLGDILLYRRFRNLGSAEGKYFSMTVKGAASYAKQAYYGFGDPPYTLVKTKISNSLLRKLDMIFVDRGIPAIVVPDSNLLSLVPQVLNFLPLPSR